MEKVCLAPFSLVRNCRFSNAAKESCDNFKIFKLHLFAHNITYYFGTEFAGSSGNSEQVADRDRTTWVLDISHAVRLVTQSLFPHGCQIATLPLAGVPTTTHRLMAGYLLHDESPGVVTCIYAELHAHMNSSVRLYFYEDETCMKFLQQYIITERTNCQDKVGINCSCFTIDSHCFSCRTLQERRFWLRAISNVKVKLQNGAPEPTQNELAVFRLKKNFRIKNLVSTANFEYNCCQNI